MNQHEILMKDDKLKTLFEIKDYKEFSIAIDVYLDEHENIRKEFNEESITYIYEQIIKKAVECKVPLTNLQWRDVIKTITLLCEKYFPFYPLDNCYRLFYKGLLLSNNFNLAKHYIDKFEDYESVSLEVSKHFFNLSQNGKDEYIISAMNCLTIAKSSKKEVLAELDFILAIIWLSKYLPDLKPQEVLKETNRKRFIKELLDVYPQMYKQLPKILELGNMLGCCSTSEERNSLKLLVAETAFENGDFDYCGEIIKNLVSVNYHHCWKLASELAFNERFKDIEYRLTFLSFAMMYCEDDMLKEFLECKKALQSKLNQKSLSDNYFNPIDDIHNDYMKFHIKISSFSNIPHVKVLLENLVETGRGEKIVLINKIKYFFALEILSYLKPNDFKNIDDIFFIPPNQLLHYYDTIVESSDIEEKLNDIEYLKGYFDILKVFNKKSDEILSLKRNLQEGLSKDFDSIAQKMERDLKYDQPIDISSWTRKYTFNHVKTTPIYKQPIYGEHYDAILLYLIVQADKISLFAKIEPIFKEIINLLKYLYDIETPSYLNDNIQMKNDYERVKNLFNDSGHDSFTLQREKIVCKLMKSYHLIQAGYALLELSNHPNINNVSFDSLLSHVHQFLELSLHNLTNRITSKGYKKEDLVKRKDRIIKALEIYEESIQNF